MPSVGGNGNGMCAREEYKYALIVNKGRKAEEGVIQPGNTVVSADGPARMAALHVPLLDELFLMQKQPGVTPFLHGNASNVMPEYKYI